MKINIIYTDELTLSEIIYGWEYFATIGVVGYGVLLVAGKFL